MELQSHDGLSLAVQDWELQNHDGLSFAVQDWPLVLQVFYEVANRSDEAFGHGLYVTSVGFA